MAKAKILYDRISIKSDILTDENLERVKILCPSALLLTDDNNDTVLYGVDKSDSLATFNNNGACFKDGQTIGTVDKATMELPTDKRADKINTLVTAMLTRINAIEEQVTEYIIAEKDLSEDIEFVDFEEVTEEETIEKGGKK